MRKLYFTIILFAISFFNARAQDANYWSAAYNPAGLLSPGSSVAFTRDSGVLYFNPALLAYNTKSTASISGSVYQLNSIRVKDGVGNGLNLKSSNLGIVPVMATGILAIKGITIGYAVIQNPVINFNASQQLDTKFNVLDDSYSPGAENFLGQYSAQNTINETSAILATGFKVAPHLAFGVAAQGQYRTQTLEQNYSARAIVNQTTTTGLPPITNAQTSYQVTHYNVSLKFKVGLAYDNQQHHVGLNVTSPLVRLKSGSELLSDNLVTNLHITAENTFDLLASNRQTKLGENYKMPLSVALGYAYDLGDQGQIYLSSEYFKSVAEYNIITPRAADFIRISGDPSINSATPNLLKLKDARKSIMNFGAGFTYLLKPNVTGFVSARTDFSYYDVRKYANDDGYVSNVTNYNIYHGQIGANLKKRKFNLRTGLLLDYGHTKAYPQPVDMTSANESNALEGETHNVKASFFSIGVMFAYIYNL